MKIKKCNFLQLTNENEEILELYLYGDIVEYSWWENDVTANDIKERIENSKAELIKVHINSLGGDVFTGIAIYNLLKQHRAKVHVYVDSCAASIASVIAMAGDKILMPKNTLMMIHNCWTICAGNSKELRKTADDMDKIMNASIESYLSKVNISREELIKLLDAETWLTAEECLEKGFADEIISLDNNDGFSQSNNIFNLIKKIKEKDNELNEKLEIIKNKDEQIKELKEKDKDEFNFQFLKEIIKEE